MARIFVLAFFSLRVFACENEMYFPCSASQSFYTISVDAVQTTFAKRNIHISIGEDTPDGLVHIKNNTPYALYSVTNQKLADAPASHSRASGGTCKRDSLTPGRRPVRRMRQHRTLRTIRIRFNGTADSVNSAA